MEEEKAALALQMKRLQEENVRLRAHGPSAVSALAMLDAVSPQPMVSNPQPETLNPKPRP